MQMAVVEYARNVCKLNKANSSEFDAQTPYPVIDLLPGKERSEEKKGASMRLGAWPCVLKSNSFAHAAYEQKRFPSVIVTDEFNNKYKKKLMDKGLRITGVSPDGLFGGNYDKDHPWFVGCRFIPEFKSRPTKPHPLFKKFIDNGEIRTGQDCVSISNPQLRI